ncbi:bifunctional preprotein translocase subunit SecD/SecF [Streptomyces lincolnensis]|uniref:Multifunctional fusion protein n=1 Tax=Streptomyces lincolnensis TaxID=1915 RepID=A0A1B1MK88_STRLN|nr:protein translocase subunit SecD [Streptomyces lincolnensis]ANS68927.1 bifunctional preprotein translocase subunit SecD/SecF [Streptomyces lincolnensis]QMV10522.1 protein translocase subunit SecD [Streptomyces lincolnensis]
MSRAPMWRAIVALGVIAASLFFALTQSPRLGLDLRGGTQIVLETKDSPVVKADAESTQRALEVLRQRVDALGVSEPSLYRSGQQRIFVELPGVQDPREAAEVIGRTAQLTVHPVQGATDKQDENKGAPAKDGSRTLADPDQQGAFLRLGPTALTGEGVKDAEAVLDQQTMSGWTVNLSFRGQAGKDWARITGAAACAPQGAPERRVAIVLDGKVLSAPGVNPDVACEVGISGGSTQITGGFGREEARELAALVKGGALPVPVEVVEQRTVGPTLGADAIAASAQAAIIGLALTGLFILVVYRLLGALATIALALYGLISYAALVALGATLTLPGLAGFVLAIGMAVDANVLVFERAREEYLAVRALKSASAHLDKPLRTGFDKTWSAVVDSNVTTLLAAGLLFFFATGPVKGFGVTLSIGVLVSMISALVITRVLADLVIRRRFVRNRPGLTGIASTGRVRTWLAHRKPRLVHHRRRWFGVSALLIVVAVAGIGLRGLDFGVEFTGGRLVEYSTSKPVDVDAARSAVSDAGFPRALVQESGDGDISVRTGELSNDQQHTIKTALAAEGGEVTVERDELIGPSLGDELRRNALITLGIAVAAQLIYLSVRFRWTFAAAAVSAMVHDVLLVVGLFAWLGKPVDSVFLAALLTVIGYSVNDTVVVFDRVREARRRDPAADLETTANRAVIQTLPRTVNTGLGALFILAALAVLGGDSLADFSVALIAGVVIGMASTVFTAVPIAVQLEGNHPAPPVRPERGEDSGSRRPLERRGRARGSGAVV